MGATRFLGGEYHENKFIEFWISRCDHRSRGVDNLLFAGLDDAGADDEHDGGNGSYGHDQVRLGAITTWRFRGTYCLELICGNIRLAFGGNLQQVDQGLKPPAKTVIRNEK